MTTERLTDEAREYAHHDARLVWIIENTTQVRVRDLALDVLNNPLPRRATPADNLRAENDRLRAAKSEFPRVREVRDVLGSGMTWVCEVSHQRRSFHRTQAEAETTRAALSQPSDDLQAEGCDPHRFAVLSADFSRPFLLGAYPTIENAVQAQCGSPDKWPIYERAVLSQKGGA